MKPSLVLRLALAFSVLPVALSSMPTKAEPSVWTLVYEEDDEFKFKWYVDASSIQKKGKYTLVNVCLHTRSDRMVNVVDQDLNPWCSKEQVGKKIDCNAVTIFPLFYIRKPITRWHKKFLILLATIDRSVESKNLIMRIRCRVILFSHR